MNKLEILTKINDYSFDGNNDGIIELLNNLFDTGEYKQYLNLVFNAISITQMYGFLSYLTEEEQFYFLQCDLIRSESYRGKMMKYYNSGQLSLLFDLEKNKKIFLSAPTSFGKTSIIIEYILFNFKIFNNILFIVPTNSLLEELYHKITLLNKENEMSYRISTRPYVVKEERNFLLLTPERFLLVSEQISTDYFDLIVMDETYKIVDSKNEAISDFLESRSLRFRKVADMVASSNNHIIFLSPFTYSLTKSMENFLTKYNVVKIDRKLEYVSREIIKITNAKEFEKEFEPVTGYTTSISQAKKVNFILNKMQNKKNIVYVSCYSDAYRIVDELTWNRQIQENPRYQKFIEHLEKNYDISVKHEWKIITALKKGIGIYVAPLPRYIKKEIIKLYEENVLGTLIVTTAFTEGVNTNASNLIFTTLVNGPKINKLSDIDILNVSGRAGRFAKSSIGKIYCIKEDVFQRAKELQNNANIRLENYNYKQTTLGQNRNDYELDMMDDSFLTENEIFEKEETEFYREKLDLTKEELNISLNVSLKWKLILYSAINENNTENLYNACNNILSEEPNKRIDSLDLIFQFIKDSFSKTSIDAFSTKPYEIKAFDNSGKFIWSRLYKVYCAGKTKDIISKNVSFIKNEFKSVLESISFSYPNVSLSYINKKEIESYFISVHKRWILDYYTSDLKLNYDAFYTETFKFISSIVQYKIPFYVSFVTSIIRLYISKNMADKYDISKLDPKKSVVFFENGDISSEYEELVDFGISNDLILKLKENNILYSDLINMKVDNDIFDDYEKLIIKEFVDLI